MVSSYTLALPTGMDPVMPAQAGIHSWLVNLDASLRWHDKLCLLALLLFTSTTALAEPTIAGFYLDQNVQASHNPLGVQLGTKVFYRLPVFDCEGMLWESAKLDVGFQNNLSPGYELAGFFAKFEPIAFFDIAATAQVAGYFNTLGYGFFDLPSYNSWLDPSEEFLPYARNALGYVVSVAPTFKFAIDPIAASNTFSLSYFYADDGKGYFFERIGNVPLAKSDIELINSAYLLAQPYKDLYVGVNDWILYLPGSGYISHRLSGVAAYTARFSETFSAYAGLFMGTFLADRYFQYAFFVGGQMGVTIKL